MLRKQDDEKWTKIIVIIKRSLTWRGSYITDGRRVVKAVAVGGAEDGSHGIAHGGGLSDDVIDEDATIMVDVGPTALEFVQLSPTRPRKPASSQDY